MRFALGRTWHPDVAERASKWPLRVIGLIRRGRSRYLTGLSPQEVYGFDEAEPTGKGNGLVGGVGED